jgi:hypothetical protein
MFHIVVETIYPFSTLLNALILLWIMNYFVCCCTNSGSVLEQSMGARNRVGIGCSYRPTRLHRLAESIPGVLKSLKIPSLYSITLTPFTFFSGWFFYVDFKLMACNTNILSYTSWKQCQWIAIYIYAKNINKSRQTKQNFGADTKGKGSLKLRLNSRKNTINIFQRSVFFTYLFHCFSSSVRHMNAASHYK